MCVWFWSANSRGEMMIYQTGGIWGPMDFLSLATSLNGLMDAMPCLVQQPRVLLPPHPHLCRLNVVKRPFLLVEIRYLHLRRPPADGVKFTMVQSAQLIGLVAGYTHHSTPSTMAIAIGKLLVNHGSLMVFRYFPDPETPKSPDIPNFDG